MPNIYNAGQLATIIAKAAEMDVPDLGADSSAQNSYIYSFLNIIMMKYFRVAYQEMFSDALNITQSGYVQFKSGGQIITDMAEPEKILDMGTANEIEIQKRSSYSAPVGWWRGGQNQDIHVRGLNGNYKLVYIKYPARVTIDTDTIEFPPSGYDLLIKETVSMIKYVKNSYAGSDYFDSKAKVALGEAVQGAISARGTGSSGQPPGSADALTGRGG
jgi:hypothetical protein